LNKFCIEENIISVADVSKFIDPTFIQRRAANLENLVKPYYKRRIVYERDLSFDENMWNVDEDAYLAGYWQDLRYFSDHENVIRDDLRFKHDPDPLNEAYLKKITDVESVGIHVRRGDYLTDKFTVEQVGMADMKYYRNAIEYIYQNSTDPRYFVFTDDPDWVRTHFDVSVKYELIAHNGQEKGYEDLRLLSACCHQVISNSSFGWWGAWLNNNKDKIVVAPKVWRKNGPDMFKPENWVIM
jgi:hypothetical protein